MQDIAGVRLVIEGTRLDQDRVVERILELFPDARMVDRREKPSYGYRAVHVIVRTRGCLVEVQVRTYLQNMWAQIIERLADLYGRQIRYGEPPTDPDGGRPLGRARAQGPDERGRCRTPRRDERRARETRSCRASTPERT
jgi:Region found in RelA / SpoT proteins